MSEHNVLTGSSIHEEKLISTSGTSDAGKVVTPSSSTAGTGTLRNLVWTEVNSKKQYVTAELDDISTASSTYIPINVACTVTRVESIIHGALATGDVTLTVKPNGVAATNGTITVTQSGSAAGDVDTCSPTAGNALAVGEYIELETNGASTNAVRVTFMLELTLT